MHWQAALETTCWLLPAAYAALVFRYWRSWRSLPPAGPGTAAQAAAVSIVVAARNEAGPIGQCLDSLLSQDYGGDWEIVVVDDCSADGTASMVRRRMEKAPPGKLRLVELAKSLPEKMGSKKAALDAGIRQARYGWIATTDADCTAGPQWLRTMMAFAGTSGAAFVAGPVRLGGRRPFDRIQAVEFAGLAGTGAATLGGRRPLLCNGANLAFEKALYDRVHRSEAMAKEPATGDDTFFMLAVRRRRAGRMAFVKSADALVTARAAGGLPSFFSQRIRWASKIRAYRETYIVLTGLLAFSVQALLWIAGFTWATGSLRPEFFLTAVLLKMTPEAVFIQSLSRVFGLSKPGIWFLPAFAFQCLYVPWVAVTVPFARARWKGRRG
jgi:cellulose synthase/poly-beta-1,6-N-acetylglucosamine synthase-like glycosyltransferase